MNRRQESAAFSNGVNAGNSSIQEDDTMRLGILVNTNKNLEEVLRLSNAALSKGHEVVIFAMDQGTKLLEQPFFTGLCSLPGVAMSFCDHSAERLGVKTEGIPKEATCGSQYNNAVMIHNADKVIVL